MVLRVSAAPASPRPPAARRAGFGRRARAGWTLPLSFLVVAACGDAATPATEVTGHREDALGATKLQCGGSTTADGFGWGPGSEMSGVQDYFGIDDEARVRELQRDVCEARHFNQATWDRVLDEAEAAAIDACERNAANTVACDGSCADGGPACRPEFRAGSGACAITDYGTVTEEVIVQPQPHPSKPWISVLVGYCLTSVQAGAAVTGANVGCGKRACKDEEPTSSERMSDAE